MLHLLVGSALAAPVLSTPTLTQGRAALLEADGAAPGDTVHFAYSLAGRGAGPCVPALGLCLDLRSPVTLIGSTTADASGHASLLVTVPLAAPVGLNVSLQAVEDGAATSKSNALTVQVGAAPAPVDHALGGADTRATGDVAGDHAGQSVAFLGDVGGSAMGDFAVGAPFSDAGNVESGAVYVVHGGPALVDLGAADAVWSGIHNTGHAGYALADAGDVDHAGGRDLLVGAPDDSTTFVNGGEAYLLDASLTGARSLSTATAVFTSTAAGDHVGGAVAGVGDTDGDGYDDVLVGAYGLLTAVDGRGGAFLVRGPVAGNVPLSTADGVVTGSTFLEQCGYAVAGPGDVDGDGLADLLVGSPLWDAQGATDAGAAFLTLGPVTGVTTTAAWDGRYAGTAASDRAGIAVSGAGDFDGDGTPDLAVGAFFTDVGGNNAGTAYVVTEALGNHPLSGARLKLNGDEAGENLGVSVSPAGDLDQDGLDDVMVAAPFGDHAGLEAGVAYVVWGGSVGTMSVADAPITLSGAAAGDQAGWGLASGDVDLDGAPDLLVGATNSDLGGADAGGAFLVYAASL